MKRLLFLIATSLFISYTGYSQCTPDLSNTHVGILPDSATNLPHAVVGVPYSTVMQVYVPVDTVSGSITCDYDYVKLTSMTGLPAGWTYACVPNNCTFPGNSHGCVLLTGPAPLASDAGNDYVMHVVVTYTLHIHGFPTLYCVQDATQNIDYYHIPVDPAPTGIASHSAVNFDMWLYKPNPFSKSTVVKFSTPKADTYTFKISNILGETQFSKVVTASSGINEIALSEKDMEALKGGVYLYSLGNSRNAITRRMLIQ
jgi:hypothetical protein